MYQLGKAGKHCFVATATGKTRTMPSIANKSPYDQEFKEGGEKKVLKNAESLGKVFRLGALQVNLQFHAALLSALELTVTFREAPGAADVPAKSHQHLLPAALVSLGPVS